MAKRTMKAFDEMCLTPVEEMTPEKVRALRLRENASQAVFARHLNVTAGLVSQWERGEKRPRGASLKLLTLVAKNGLGCGRVRLGRARPLFQGVLDKTAHTAPPHATVARAAFAASPAPPGMSLHAPRQAKQVIKVPWSR